MNRKSILKRGFSTVMAAAVSVTTLFGGINSTANAVEAATIDSAKVLSMSFEGDLKDASGKGNDGVAVGTVGYSDEGVSGKALHLTGAGYVNMGTSEDLQPSKLTVSFWLKAPSTGLSGEQMIIWNKADGNYAAEGWYMGSASDTRPIEVSLGKDASQPYKIFVSGSRSEFFPAGEWVHVAVTYDSDTREAAIYRNGVAQSVSTEYDTAEGVIRGTADVNWLGTNSPIYGAKSVFDIDELEIYSACASEDDVTAMYVENGGVIDNEELLKKDMEALTIPEETTTDISLPTKGSAGVSAITWSSSDPDVISDTGKVTRPEAGQDDAVVTLTATLTNGEYQDTKTFRVVVYSKSDLTDLYAFAMEDVLVTDAYEDEALQLDVDNMLELDADRLLAGFRETAAYAYLSVHDSLPGDETVAEFMKNKKRYGGYWENSLIGGHTMGHYLTALAQASVNPGLEQEKKEKVDERLGYIIESLKECQDMTVGTDYEGYIFGAELKNNTTNLDFQFDNVEKNLVDINTQAWVPWYTMHKIIAGLVSTYELTGNDDALTVASGLGDWTYNRVCDYTESQQKIVLNTEYGGMNDCLYELYSITEDEKHLQAAHMFDEVALFEKIKDGGSNLLDNVHANTTIPKFIGALNRYVVVEDEEYLGYAEAFWDYVVEHHTYITGGDSENERFWADDTLNAKRDNLNNETCNTYNMLKLTRMLFMITGDSKYSDYYERTLKNAIMASQDHDSGLTMYFQPMATGYQKVYSSLDDSFWCCTGSGYENFTKLNDSIYFYKNNELVVTQYIASEVTWTDQNVKVIQDCDLVTSEKSVFKLSAIDNTKDAAITLELRIPDWAASAPVIKVNGEEQDYIQKSGYAKVAAEGGDEIEISLPMEVVAYNLPDSENTYAFKYGPFVLSAKLGTAKQGTTSWGVGLSVPSTKAVNTDRIGILNEEETVSNFMENINDNLVKKEDALEFSLVGTDHDSLVFVPHYSQTESYGIYWTYTVGSDGIDPDTVLSDKQSARFDDAMLSYAQAGYGQYEIGLIEENSVADSNVSTRYAQAGGYFQYNMNVERGGDNYLLITVSAEDDGLPLKISAGDTVIFDQLLDSSKTIYTQDAVVSNEKLSSDEFYQIKIRIAQEVVDADSQQDGDNYIIPIKFEGSADADSAKLHTNQYTLRAYDSTTNEMTSLAVDGVSGLKQDGKNYTVTVAGDVTSIKIIAGIADEKGYLAINGWAFQEDQKKKVQLSGSQTVFTISAYSQDFATKTDYTLTVIREIADFDMASLKSAYVAGYAFNNEMDGVVAVTKAAPPAAVSDPDYTYTEGIQGSAISLDGASYGLKFPVEASALGESYTVSFWMKPDSVSGVNDPTLTAGKFAPEYWLNLTLVAKIWSYRDGYVDNSATNAYTAGEWQHVTLTVDGSGSDAYATGKLYVNGTQVQDGNVAKGIMTQAGAYVYFGVNAWDAYFGGALDEVMLYNRALTEEEVSYLANRYASADEIASWAGTDDKPNPPAEDTGSTDDEKKQQANTITAKNISKTAKAKKQTIKIGATALGSAKLTYTSSSKKITVNSSGTVTIPKNYAGKATITIKAAATSAYKAASKKITVTVKPAAVKKAKIKATGKKKAITVKYKKAVGAVKYKVEVSTSKKFTKKTTKSKTVKKLTATIKKLKANKKYYVRVTAIGNSKVTSKAIVAKKTVKTKK